MFERDLFKPVAPLKKVEVKQAPEPRNKTISFESTTPWNATGFYYTPRYPQSHRGKRKLHMFFLNPHCYKLPYNGPIVYFIERRSPSRHKWRFCI